MFKVSNFLVVFLISQLVAAQSPVPVKEYEYADSVAYSVTYQNDIYKLTQDLTKNLKSEVLKIRAIFKWITNNIRYDIKYFNKHNYKGKEPKSYKCSGELDCITKRKELESNLIRKVLKRKRAVCAGYSLLFQKMCEIIGVHAEVLSGYVRTRHYQVGTAGVLDHAWNSVLLGNKYYLLDVTWASGFCTENEDGKLIQFYRRYDDYYWLTRPEDFVRNHFPEKPEWTLVSEYSKERFSTNPYYASGVVEHIQLIQPASGVVQVHKGDTIHFELHYRQSINRLQINSNVFSNPNIWKEVGKGRRKSKVIDSIAISKQQYVDYKKENDLYKFTYVVTENSLYYIDILFDYQRVMRFKVSVNK